VDQQRQFASPVLKPHLLREFSEEELKELAKCGKNVHNFCRHVKVLHPVGGIIDFDPYSHQKELLVKFQNFRFNICLSSRQSGKTTVVAVYALWKAMFNKNLFIGIASNKFDSSKDFLNRIRTIYENLPDYMKPGVVHYNVSTIVFDNGSRIECAATTPYTFRGRSISLLIFDEMASVDPPSMAQEMWSAIFPTVSQGGNVIIISTPMGVGNLYYDLWMDAIAGRNEFVTTQVDWDSVPGRDEEWRRNMIENLGSMTKWNREYGNQFIGSTSTVILPEDIQRLQSTLPPKNSIQTIDAFDGSGQFRVLEPPVKNGQYIIGADVSKGVGANDSVAQIFRIVKEPTADEDDHSKEWLKQVAVFSTNTIAPRQFSHILFSIGKNYNDALVAVENNAEGFQVADILWNDVEYENLVNWKPKGQKKRFEPGIKSTKQSKEIAVTIWKQEVEAEKVHFFDYETVKQISCFVEENGKCFGQGALDDHVAAAYWACFTWDLYKKGKLGFDVASIMGVMRQKRGPASDEEKRKIKLMKRKEKEQEGEKEEIPDDVEQHRRKILTNKKIQDLAKYMKAEKPEKEDEEPEDEPELMVPIFDDDPTEGEEWKDPYQI
jgi:hypothetical protein